MKYLIEIEVKNTNTETGAETETSISLEELESTLQLGFEDTNDDNGFSHLAYDLKEEDSEGNPVIPYIKGYSIKQISA